MSVFSQNTINSVYLTLYSKSTQASNLNNMGEASINDVFVSWSRSRLTSDLILPIIVSNLKASLDYPSITKHNSRRTSNLYGFT